MKHLFISIALFSALNSKAQLKLSVPVTLRTAQAKQATRTTQAKQATRTTQAKQATRTTQAKQEKQAVQIPQGRTFDLDKLDEITTTNVAIYKGRKHEVFATRTGKLYIKTTTKEGKPSRKYINID